jgi:hypothetical protein
MARTTRLAAAARRHRRGVNLLARLPSSLGVFPSRVVSSGKHACLAAFVCTPPAAQDKAQLGAKTNTRSAAVSVRGRQGRYRAALLVFCCPSRDTRLIPFLSRIRAGRGGAEPVLRRCEADAATPPRPVTHRACDSVSRAVGGAESNVGLGLFLLLPGP